MPDEVLSADKAHGQPIEFRFGGKTYKMGRVRIADLAALQERIRDRRIEALMRNRTRVASPDVFAKTLAALIATDPTEADLWEAMLSNQGRIFLMWRSVNRYHPEITEDQIGEMLEQSAELGSLLLGESGLTAPAGEVDPAANPTGTPQSAGLKTPRCFAGTAASDSAKSETSNGPNTAASSPQ